EKVPGRHFRHRVRGLAGQVEQWPKKLPGKYSQRPKKQALLRRPKRRLPTHASYLTSFRSRSIACPKRTFQRKSRRSFSTTSRVLSSRDAQGTRPPRHPTPTPR